MAPTPERHLRAAMLLRLIVPILEKLGSIADGRATDRTVSKSANSSRAIGEGNGRPSEKKLREYDEGGTSGENGEAKEISARV